MAKGRRTTGGEGGGGGRRTKIGIGVEVKSTSGSKGRGGVQVSPTLTVERERGKGRTRPAERKGRAPAQLLDLHLEEVTPAAKWLARGDRLTAVGSGAGLVFLSDRGTVGLASPKAAEAIRAALAASPHAQFESRVTAASARGVRVSVTLLGATEVDGSAARAAVEAQAMPPAETAAALPAPGRRGR